MNKILSVAILCLIISCDQNHPTKYAIVYGISDYPYVGIDLPFSANDAVSIGKLLEKYGYSVILRTDSSATMLNLENDINRISQITNPGDLFFFYFSGHGISQNTMIDFGDSSAPAGYFSMLLYHKPVFKTITEYIENSGLTKEKINYLVNMIPCHIKCEIVDACYSGTIINKKDVVDYTPSDYNGKNDETPDFQSIFRDATHSYKQYLMSGNKNDPEILTITSSGGNEISWDGFFSHSVFTYFFLMSAEQGDLNGDGQISALESYAYTRAAFEKYWNTTNNNADWNYLPQITVGSEDVILFDHASIVNSSILAP